MAQADITTITVSEEDASGFNLSAGLIAAQTSDTDWLKGDNFEAVMEDFNTGLEKKAAEMSVLDVVEPTTLLRKWKALTENDYATFLANASNTKDILYLFEATFLEHITEIEKLSPHAERFILGVIQAVCRLGNFTDAILCLSNIMKNVKSSRVERRGRFNMSDIFKKNKGIVTTSHNGETVWQKDEVKTFSELSKLFDSDHGQIATLLTNLSEFGNLVTSSVFVVDSYLSISNIFKTEVRHDVENVGGKTSEGLNLRLEKPCLVRVRMEASARKQFPYRALVPEDGRIIQERIQSSAPASFPKLFMKGSVKVPVNKDTSVLDTSKNKRITDIPGDADNYAFISEIVLYNSSLGLIAKGYTDTTRPYLFLSIPIQ